MKKSVDERMAKFHRELNEFTGDKFQQAVERGLADSSSLIVEMAAQAVVDFDASDCTQQMRAAYDQFVVDQEDYEPLKWSDKGCRAKLPLVTALAKQGYDDEQFYLEGMKYIQMEPTYGAEGGYEDKAAHLRGAHAFGLTQCQLASRDDVLFALIDLLHDTQWVTREHAARALSSVTMQAATAVLRMKVQAGDDRSEVIGACFSGLVASDSNRFLDYVADFLNSKNLDLAIEAGLALGESRSAEATTRLVQATNEAWTHELKHSHMMSLGLSRQSKAIEFLIFQIGGKDRDTAKVAIAALAPNRFDENTRDRILTAVNKTKDRVLAAEFAEHFSV